MPDDLKKWFFRRMALNYMTAGKPVKAEKWYRRLEKTDPDSLEVLHNLGVISISLKKFREAENYISREIEAYGESGIRLRVLGDLYYADGSMDKAGSAYGKALAQYQEHGGDKSTENFLMKRMTICKDRSLSARAMESGILLEKGQELFSKKLFDEALECFLRAAESDRSSYMALNSAGAILMNNRKDYSAARDFFRKALDLADIPLIKQNLALAEHKIKESGGKQ